MGLIKPPKLNPGDKVATVSLSWGGAGDEDILWRYNAGKHELQNEFGLEVVEMPNVLKGSQYLYEHPELRAKDMMDAFADNSIKAVFSCIGGDDSVRMLPYVNYSIIGDNPKIFMGYSDTTVAHMICRKAGLSSFYGPSILAEFAENGGMHGYTKKWVQKALFSVAPIGRVEPPDDWTSEYLPWLEKNKDKHRTLQKNSGYDLIQGKGCVRGHMIGGCMEVLEMLKGTELWPDLSAWSGAILFFETSEDKPQPNFFEYWLRNYGSMGILQSCNGIIFGKPYDQQYYEEYKRAILKVIRYELGLYNLPILCNVSFGHTSPMTVIPYGANAEIDCDLAAFNILDSAVIERECKK